MTVQLDSIAPPIRGRQPHPALGLAVLLAARLAVARAGDAHAAPRPGRALVLPERPPRAEDGPARPPDPPRGAGAARHEQLAGQARAASGRIERDLGSGRTELIFDWDMRRSHAATRTGCDTRTRRSPRTAIVEGDPLSAEVRVENTSVTAVGDWQVSIRAIGVMTCTATHFLVTSELEVQRGRGTACSRARGRTSSRATTRGASASPSLSGTSSW